MVTGTSVSANECLVDENGCLDCSFKRLTDDPTPCSGAGSDCPQPPIC